MMKRIREQYKEIMGKNVKFTRADLQLYVQQEVIFEKTYNNRDLFGELNGTTTIRISLWHVIFVMIVAAILFH